MILIIHSSSIKSRSEFFMLSSEIEDGDEVEVGNWAKHKKTFFSFIFFCCFFFNKDNLIIK
jgi:hypothetical protein